MDQELTTVEDALAELDDDVRETVGQLIGRLRGHVGSAAVGIWKAGGVVRMLKDMIPHGQYLKVVERDTPYSAKQAQNWANINERFTESEVKQFNGGQRALEILAAPSTPQKARDKALKDSKSGTRVSERRAKSLAGKDINQKRTGRSLLKTAAGEPEGGAGAGSDAPYDPPPPAPPATNQTTTEAPAVAKQGDEADGAADREDAAPEPVGENALDRIHRMLDQVEREISGWRRTRDGKQADGRWIARCLKTLRVMLTRKADAEAVSGEPLPEELDTDEFRSEWRAWVKSRAKQRKPTNADWARTTIEKLKPFGPIVSAQAVKQSRENSWTGVFPEKVNEQRSIGKAAVRRGNEGADYDPGRTAADF